MLTAADKDIREKRIGASEVAAVLGISPYSGPFDVWARITQGIQREERPELAVGNYLEPAIIRWAEDYTGQRTTPGVSRVHPRLDWLSATPDAIVLTPGGDLSHLMDAKTDRYRDAWGEPGTDGVPAYLAAQFQVQMAVWDVDRVDVPVLFKLSDEFALFHVKRDEAVIDAILTQCAAWHEKHVVRGEMPSLDGGNAAGEYLKRRYPGGGGAMAQATDEQAALVREYVAAKAVESAAKDASAVLRQRVIFEIKDSDGLVLTDSERISFRADKRGQRSLRLSGFKGSAE